MKKFIIAFIALAITSSCNSSNDDISTPSQPVVNTTPILPTTVSDNLSGTLYNYKYSYYDGNKIKEIVQDNGVKYTYTYSGNNIIKEQTTFSGQSKLIKEFSYASSGMITSVKVTSNLTSPTTAIVYTKDIQILDNKHIKYDEYSPISGNVVSSVEAYFDNNGNLIKKVDGGIEINSTFDTKSNPFNNIMGYKILNMVEDSIGGLIGEGMAGSNNILTMNSATYTYIYNSNGYPTRMTSSSTGRITSYTYNK
ncbi:hypothetical protein D1632_03155 [Chryseobacterium nematophagum]|uniref:YD repeat-containing protein n=1 Tax=Chryseobacterium nematophagum TaxID=2305228 RepID=A0A3M7LHF2_9FLAO|nr:hypothetical protein [Chryseobacterium nematophagum]RMZ60982.1 hypothetical protein D1632_03155 [Chryseobacterium nematophagum]